MVDGPKSYSVAHNSKLRLIRSVPDLYGIGEDPAPAMIIRSGVKIGAEEIISIGVQFRTEILFNRAHQQGYTDADHIVPVGNSGGVDIGICNGVSAGSIFPEKNLHVFHALYHFLGNKFCGIAVVIEILPIRGIAKQGRFAGSIAGTNKIPESCES